MTKRKQLEHVHILCSNGRPGLVLLRPHKLKVSFATLQQRCRWCTDPAYPILSHSFT